MYWKPEMVEEAMDIFYEEKDIALLILDVMMPKMDGWEV